eukprot:m51a1_g12607 putative von willebrand factor type a (565) ;mRNA; r:611-2970
MSRKGSLEEAPAETPAEGEAPEAAEDEEAHKAAPQRRRTAKKTRTKSNLKEQQQSKEPATPPLAGGEHEDEEESTGTSAPKPIAPSASTLVREKLVESFAGKAKSREIELVFAFDTTASMVTAIGEVRKKISEMSRRLLKEIPGIRIGLIAFADYDSESYVINTLDLCQDTDKLCEWTQSVKGTRGWTVPEAYELVLHRARSMSWKAPNRALVLIGDSVPHRDTFTDQKTYWRDELDELVKMDVKVYGVVCRTGRGPGAAEEDAFYQEVSDRSGGIFLELRQFELMNDMFMAVCFKEFSDDRVEAYRQEICAAAGGQLDEGHERMFASLRRGPSKLGPVQHRDYEWWERDAPGDTVYYYNAAKDRWSAKPLAAPAAAAAAAAAPAAAPAAGAKRKRAAPSPKKRPAKRARNAEEAVEPSSESEQSEDEEEVEEAEAEEEEQEEEEEAKPLPKKRGRKPGTAASRKGAASGRKKSAGAEASAGPASGDDLYVRGDAGEVWVCRVAKRSARGLEVEWYEELARLKDQYALVKWHDTIPAASVIGAATMRLNKATGLYERVGKMPKF